MAGRILVLDDEEHYAEMLQELLREQNYLVDMATRAQSALEQLEQIPYDLVISDYKMPVMDGADFLQKARELYPNLPFILVSGLMNTPELVKVANMSVTLVMEKPLDTVTFLSHVARFSTPMTGEEQAAMGAGAQQHDDAVEAQHAFPQVPQFFSAASATSKRFLQNAWEICCEHSHLFILEPTGGDGDLALQDLCAWHGNSDQPMLSLTFEDLVVADTEGLHKLYANADYSLVVAVRLSSVAQIAEARNHWLQVLQADAAARDILFVYRLAGPVTPAEFTSQADMAGCVLPQLRERPADIAVYASRFSALLAEQLGEPRATELTAEAVYAMMAFEWPGNYVQLEAVMTAVVQDCAGEPMSLDAFKHALGEIVVPAPEARLASLMAHAQARHFETALAASGEPASVLARRLELGSSAQSIDDLQQLPLINAKLASL